jgi:predicted ATPase with chaperone activity
LLGCYSALALDVRPNEHQTPSVTHLEVTMAGKIFPQPLKNLPETGLAQAFLAELVLKHLLFLGEFRMADLADRIRLPMSIIELVLEEHRKEKLIEVTGAANYYTTSYVYKLTELGRRRGQQAMELCRYAGPAPVSLKQYRHLVELQTVQDVKMGAQDLEKALSHLVINDAIRKRLGPAMISGQAVFLYGPSGNGKTSIAEAMGCALAETIFLPYAITVGEQIINVFDPVSHIPAEAPRDQEPFDSRWILVKRPVIIAGGELSLKMLDLNFDQISKCYDASLQMKANNGLFILDDFGRQQVEPERILNRWIVPLERRIDHMTLQTGVKFVIPFDVLVVLSSGLDPKDLVQEAFLRRLHYKIKICRPTEEEYLEIFTKTCMSQGLAFNAEVYSYLLENGYGARQLARSACHPRDLIDIIVTSARYHGQSPRLTQESIEAACCDYFGEQ